MCDESFSFSGSFFRPELTLQIHLGGQRRGETEMGVMCAGILFHVVNS